MGIQDHLTCFLKNLYAGQEAAVRTCMKQLIGSSWERSTVDCLLSSCLFNLYAEHIMRNARMDGLQAGIKRRNINNLNYTHETTLMAESKEELKNLL